jgi:hypothetical protein
VEEVHRELESMQRGLGCKGERKGAQNMRTEDRHDPDKHG